MRRILGFCGLTLAVAVTTSHAQIAVSCVSAQQRAAADARIGALAQNFDVATLGHDLQQADSDRRTALDAVQECQQNSTFGMGCGREIDAYNLADERYKIAAQQVDMYRTMAAAQANARAAELPVCR